MCTLDTHIVYVCCMTVFISYINGFNIKIVSRWITLVHHICFIIIIVSRPRPPEVIQKKNIMQKVV